MIYHISLDTNKHSKPEMYDSRTKVTTPVVFEGARSFLEEYINRNRLRPIAIHESHLPDRSQLVCWYEVAVEILPINDPRELGAPTNFGSYRP